MIINKKYPKTIGKHIFVHDDENCVGAYGTVKELVEDWEDYEEPETFWGIMSNGGITEREITSDEIRQEFIEDSKAIGNYFETKEEAEKAVEKLKAWKRLKDKGFRFSYYHEIFDNKIHIEAGICTHWSLWKENTQIREDLDLLFGGEE